MQLNVVLLAICIGLAGALGAVARYLVGSFVAGRVSSAFPLGTMIINVAGAFLIGLVFSLLTRTLISTDLELVLATGFLGGFTTFSTMNWESFRLIRRRQIFLSSLYLGGSFLFGLGAEYLGILLGKGL